MLLNIIDTFLLCSDTLKQMNHFNFLFYRVDKSRNTGYFVIAYWLANTLSTLFIKEVSIMQKGPEKITQEQLIELARIGEGRLLHSVVNA